jgi:hypothetical protein
VIDLVNVLLVQAEKARPEIGPFAPCPWEVATDAAPMKTGALGGEERSQSAN